MPPPLITLGTPIKPSIQTIGPPLLLQLFKLNPQSFPGNAVCTLAQGGTGPFINRLATASQNSAYLGIEGGWGISVANEGADGVPPHSFAKKNFMLRFQPRIDKCPWPNGERFINVKFTLQFEEGVGANHADAPDLVVDLQWDRNTTFTTTLTSNPTPPNALIQTFGYPPGNTCTVKFTLEAHGVGAGQPLVQDDGNAFTETYVQLTVEWISFSYSTNTFWYDPPDPQPKIITEKLDCPHWSILPGQPGKLNFPAAVAFFEAAQFTFPIGLVQSISWIVASDGWSNEVNDAGTTV